jgi:hypothetical protein
MAFISRSGLIEPASRPLENYPFNATARAKRRPEKLKDRKFDDKKMNKAASMFWSSIFLSTRCGQRNISPKCAVRCRHPQHAVAQNARAQSAAALHRSLRSGTKRLVHPITWLARFHAKEANALHLELATDKRIQINTARDDVAPED